MDQKTRELARHKTLHLRDKIHKLYVSRKGSREDASIDDCLDTRIQGLEEYANKNNEGLITDASKKIIN